MKAYKGIFLDWDDTIGDWTSAEHKALRDIYTQYHLNRLYPNYEAYEAAYKPYNLELWGKYGRGEVTKEFLHFERFYRPIECLEGLSETEKREMAHQIGREFLKLTNRYFSLMPNAGEVVRYLAGKYPLTIISNGFKEVQYYKFEHSGLADCFAHTIISEEVGINKPQPGIFAIALEQNGMKANEVVMVGDSYSSDIAGAKAAGMDQIWLHAGETTETATIIIPQLTDLMNIL